MERERRIQPGPLVLAGTLILVVGGLLGRHVGSTVARLDEVDSAPRCVTEFAKGCTTARAAILVRQGYTRRSWWNGNRRWRVRVPGGLPRGGNNRPYWVVVPDQDGRDELAAGMAVTVVFFGESPAWIRLPSGAMLETTSHPRREAPLLVWLTLCLLAWGVVAIRTGIRSGRRAGRWLRPTLARGGTGLDLVLGFAALAGALSQWSTGGAATLWPGIAGAVLGAGFGIVVWVWAWWASRRRPATTA